MEVNITYTFDISGSDLTRADIETTATALADGLRPGKTQVVNLGLLTYTVDRVTRDLANVEVDLSAGADFDMFEDEDIDNWFA